MSPHAERLAATYRAATPDDIANGRRWYPRARRIVRQLAREYGYTERQTAAVLAVTSPRTHLAENIKRTERALRGEPVRGFAYMDTLARDILADKRRPMRYVRGPKVTAFALAILGDRQAVVLDTHALHAAGLPDKPSASERRTAEQAYREAAAACGESPRDFQAIVWIVTRNTRERADGQIHKRRDVHEIAV